jgi:hypothetical protein
MLGEYLSGAFLNGRAHEIAHRNLRESRRPLQPRLAVGVHPNLKP